MEVTRIVLSVVLALLLLSTGAGKLAGLASSHQIRDSLAVAAPVWKMIGAFELVVVAGLLVGCWVPTVGLVAALGVVLLMAGAVVIRVRAGGEQRRAGVAADTVVLAVAVAAALVGLVA